MSYVRYNGNGRSESSENSGGSVKIITPWKQKPVYAPPIIYLKMLFRQFEPEVT